MLRSCRLAVLALLPLVGCRDREREAPETSSGSARPTMPEPAPVDAPLASPTDAGPPRPAGALQVRVQDREGHPLAARLTFVAAPGTHPPAFTQGDIGRDQPGGVLAYDRAFITGEAVLDVPHGTYDVWVSHGPEWDIATRRITITAGAPASLDVVLDHVVDTPGWVSADLHVHANQSFDSHVPMRHRAMQFVADGVDVIVSTDHNVVADYAPIIDELGITGQLASIRGDELTTHDWGHFGAFPLDTNIAAVGRTPAAIFGDVRHAAPGAVIDVHHPRLEQGRIGYFHLGELDIATMRAKRPGFSFDFDAVEVLNGYEDPDRRSVDAVLSDWFALLRRGHRVTGTGNSDSHHLTFNLGGYPRNYVQLPTTDLAQLDTVAFAAAIKSGRSMFTTGPFVEVSIGSHGMGDTITARGMVPVHVVIRAPAWIDVDRVSVIVNGKQATHRRVTGTGPRRFDQIIPVNIEHDAFVVVRVDGDKPMAPMIGDGAHFRVYPFAVTNPIWVDVDDDGVITPVTR